MNLPAGTWRWIAVAAALVFLNSTVTFHNVWPTLMIHWPGELSIELSALLLTLALSNAWLGPTRPGALAALSAVLVLFALGRYGDVTAPALYGRPVNLYWDLPNVASVVGMLTRVAPGWMVASVAIGAVLVLAVLYVAVRWSLGMVDHALRTRSIRSGVGLAGTLLIAAFTAQQSSDAIPRIPRFSIPVSRIYAQQAGRVLDTFSGSGALRTLPPSPSLRSSFSALSRDDVLLVFVESYGAVTYDRPAFSSTLQPARERLAAAARETGRAIVSGFVTSPTFGGSSWFAHISVLTGIDVGDPNRYSLLMTQNRPTLVSSFKSAGYRAIAVMPGLRQPWPEGAFYGFDQIYGAPQLDYRGPEFGWWRIPDQFSLARLDALELQPHPRHPLFVFFPTINTHMPFSPTPPLQSDWVRVLSRHPYDEKPLHTSLTERPEWTDMGGGYVSTVGYALETIASYLRERPHADFMMVILGDHQPAANVSGEGASWDVPVHVIASRPEVLASLRAQGFTPGMEPERRAVARMNELTPMLLTAFGQGPPAR